MSHAEAHPAAPAATPTMGADEIARWLDGTLSSLMLLIAAQFRTLGPLTGPVWTHFHRARARLARLLGHLAAGRLPRPHRPRPHRPRPPATTPRRPPLRPRIRLPHRRRGWLGIALDYNVRSTALQIAALLRRPGVPETLARSPGALRTLRPLCHMLGIVLPPGLALPPRPPRRRPAPPAPAPAPAPASVPAPAAAPAPPAPPDRPIPRYVRDAARAWMRPDEKRAARKIARPA